MEAADCWCASYGEMANWEALVKWSLKYHDGTRNEPQMDEEVN